jgi:hypothetical protein
MLCGSGDNGIAGVVRQFKVLLVNIVERALRQPIIASAAVKEFFILPPEEEARPPKNRSVFFMAGSFVVATVCEWRETRDAFHNRRLLNKQKVEVNIDTFLAFVGTKGCCLSPVEKSVCLG